MLETRLLNYFLAVAQEGSVSNAAKVLHVTQPTLSRQIAALEDELGRQLFIRSSKGLELTEHGVILRRYAEEIVALADKAAEEVSLPAQSVSGVVHIAVGETKVVRFLAQAMRMVQEEYPNIEFKLYSGTTADIMENMTRGNYDFFLECELQPHVNMNVLKIPEADTWGLLTRKDNPLAKLDAIAPADLADEPLIVSRQGLMKLGKLAEWAGDYVDSYTVKAEYSLPLNLKFLVSEGVGSAIVYDGLIDTPKEGGLVFVPLDPPIVSHQGLLWRKIIPTKQAQVFLDKVTQVIDGCC